MLRTAVLWVFSSLVLIGSSQAAPLVHLQTDRPSYRLGETVWYRVHGQVDEELAVELLDAEGKLISLRIHEAKRAVVKLPERFGEDLRLTLNIRSDRSKVFQLGCTYRVTDPTSSSSAPYRLSCRMDPILVMDSKAEIRVGIIPDRKAGSPSSQVIARIALPGGCEVIASEMDEIVRKREISHWESSNGYVDLYWTSDQKATSRYLDIPILPRVEGVFRARPSVVYPYYESGKEYYAEPLKVRVINTFGVTLDENGRTTPPPGVPGTPFPRRG